MREETRCRHMGYSFRLTARVLLYASSHRHDSTYHGRCYTSRGALAGTRNSTDKMNLFEYITIFHVFHYTVILNIYFGIQCEKINPLKSSGSILAKIALYHTPCILNDKLIFNTWSPTSLFNGGTSDLRRLAIDPRTRVPICSDWSAQS